VLLSHNIQQSVANQNIPQLACPEFCPGFSGNSSPNMSAASAFGKIGRKAAQSYHLFVGNISWTVSQSKLLHAAVQQCCIHCP